MRTRKTGNVNAGAAGHEGHDRQPVDGATPKNVTQQSHEAMHLKHPKHARKDMVHPGPEREEGERSKGDAHHDGHEAERIMEEEGL